MSLTTTYTKAETNYLIQQLEKKTASGYRGDLTKTDPAPTTVGFYGLTEVGIYPNLGNINAEAGKLNFASFDGSAWGLVAIEITNDAVDNLISTSTISKLSANQGRILNQNKLASIVSGSNIIKEDFKQAQIYKWAYIDGNQANNFNLEKTEENQLSKIKVVTLDAFSNDSPMVQFSSNNIFDFALGQVFYFGLNTTIFNSTYIDYELLDASNNTIQGGLYVELKNAEEKTFETTNSLVKKIKINSIIISAYRSGVYSSRPISGVSSTEIYFGVFSNKKYLPFNVLNEVKKTSKFFEDYGNTTKLQQNKGEYLFPDSFSILSGAPYMNVQEDSNQYKFKGKSLRIAINGVASNSTENHSDRGTIIFNINDKKTINESFGFWIKVPSDYWIDNQAGGNSIKSFATMTIKLLNDSTELVSKTIFTEYAFNAGWQLYKIIDENFKNKVFNKISIQITTFDKSPDLNFWIDSFVIDQRATPTLSISMDSDGVGTTNEWFWQCIGYNIPLTLSINPSVNSVAREGYLRGLFDRAVYSGDARLQNNYQSQIDYLLNDSINGRITNLNKGIANKDIIVCHNAHNYLNDSLKLAEEKAGYKLLRCANAYNRSNYIDKDSNAIQCTYFGAIANSTTVTDAWITEQINLGKNYIDELIKYGSHGCILTHNIVKRNEITNADLNMSHVYEVVWGIVEYAALKRTEGKLNIMSLHSLYENSVK